MGKKKQGFLDLDDNFDDEGNLKDPVPDAEEASGPSKQGGAKKKDKKVAKGKKGGKAAAFADDSDDDIDPLKAAANKSAAVDSDGDVPAPKKAQPKGKAGGGKKGAASAFALLGYDDDEAVPAPAESEEEEDELPQVKPKASKAKGAAKKPASSLFAALDPEDEAEESDEPAASAKVRAMPPCMCMHIPQAEGMLRCRSYSRLSVCHMLERTGGWRLP